MWIIEILNENDNLNVSKTQLINKSCLIIGRSLENDLIFPSDRSISRKHAEIRINTNNTPSSSSSSSSSSIITIKDLNSTIGTFINGDKINSNEIISIHNGDIIKFGNEHTIIRIIQFKFKFCPTRLEKDEKEKLKLMINNNIIKDGEIVKNVESSTHVLCNRFSATVKTLTAIVLQKPIVSLHWVESFTSTSILSSALIEIPDVKEFYPPGTTELTSIEKLSNSRTKLLKDMLIYLIYPADVQYEVILISCGAHVISLFGIDDIDELIRAAKSKRLNLKDHTSTSLNITTSVVFYDEGRALDTKTIHVMKRLNIPFLSSGDLATSIFSLISPQLVTHEILSQRVSTQQSQSQSHTTFQAVEFTIPRIITKTEVAQIESNIHQVQPQSTLLQTNREDELFQESKTNSNVNSNVNSNFNINFNDNKFPSPKQIPKQNQNEIQSSIIHIKEEKVYKSEVELLREKQREKELEHKKESEKEKELLLKNNNMVKGPFGDGQLTKNYSTTTFSPTSRPKRNLDELNHNDESNITTKRQRGLFHNEPDLLFNDFPLDNNIKNEPSQNSYNADYNNNNKNNNSNNNNNNNNQNNNSNYNNQNNNENINKSNLCLTDEDGWIDVNQQRSSHHSNCDNHIGYDQHLNQNLNQIKNENQRLKSIINFDEENSIKQPAIFVDNYPKPVVIEVKFEIKPFNPIPFSNSTTTTTTYLRDQRRFKKNSICRRINPDEPQESQREIIRLRKSDMDKVLPKESEREMTLNQAYENEKKSRENRESLFNDGASMATIKGRKPRFGA